MGQALSNSAFTLTQENHEWTVAVVKKLIRNSHLKISELEELKSAGLFGLIEAAQRYRPDDNCQFRSFAYKRIHGALIDHVRRSTKDSRHIFQAHKTKNPDPERAKATKQTRIIDHEHIARTALSSWLLDSERHNPEECHAQNEIRSMLTRILEKLPRRKLELIQRHYYDGEEFKSIGRSWNKSSKSWLSKLHHQILDELKEELIKSGYQHA